jgi:hypothetical protein
MILRICIGLIFFVAMINSPAWGQSFNPDTTINIDIKLVDYESVEKHLGDLMPSLNSKEPLPDIYFTNNSGSQYLRLIFFPGSTTNSFHRFEVGVKPKTMSYKLLKKYSAFKTESQIMIGITMTSVISKKGKGYKKCLKKGVTTLKYEISDKNKYPFLARYNMPSYSAEYHFVKGKLIKMIFGFDYP